ncbi:GroES-like protein [Cristinia sonorae]|uniref:GroES-like protein n=1 Tax=Cristinia sonorae TaxID=1940300 RepID=A0A8K0XT84_9AGAR|nr:GroES-like protein [Cristinia sonorae]
MSIPLQQKALLSQAFGRGWKVGTKPVPRPEANQVLVRIEAAGLNPVDWQMHTSGFDGAGVVVQVGDKVDEVEVGDRVLFESDGSGPHTATFQQYAIAYGDLVAKIPENISFDQAASVPVAYATAGIGLYAPRQYQGGAGLTPPWEADGRGKYAKQPILIMGGSSGMGQAAIQFARLSGFDPIIVTVSPRNNDYVKSLGATHTIDRSEPLSALSATVSSITKEPLKIAFDTLGQSDTQNAAYTALAPGGTLITSASSYIWKSQGKEVVEPYGILHAPSHRAFGVGLLKSVTAWLESGEYKPNRVEYIPGGLAGIPNALDRMRRGQVSASRLIVRPPETV